MLGVSHAVEVLLIVLCWWKIPYSSCIFDTVVVVACVIIIFGFSRCRGYWIWVFCCLFSCVYVYVRLIMSGYLFFCIYFFNVWYITCYPKWYKKPIYRSVTKAVSFCSPPATHKCWYALCTSQTVTNFAPATSCTMYQCVIPCLASAKISESRSC